MYPYLHFIDSLGSIEFFLKLYKRKILLTQGEEWQLLKSKDYNRNMNTDSWQVKGNIIIG